MGVIEMPVSETERRKNHIDLIDPNHALLLVATGCIRFQEKDRPSSEELCQRLADLKGSREFRESTRQIQDEVQSNSDQVLLLTQQLREKDRRIHEMEDVISSRYQQVQVVRRALQQKENENRLLQQKEKQRQEVILSREKQLRQLNQQLEEQEQVTAKIKQTNNSLQREVEQLQQQLSQQSLRPPQPPPPYQSHVRERQLQKRESRKQLPVQPPLQVAHKPHPYRVKKVTINWRDGGKAPFKMSRGAAVVDGDVVYFMKYDGEVCSYNISSRKWIKLPKYLNKYSSLAVVNDQLTAIGGCKQYYNEYTYTNKLLSLAGYKEVFPAMPTKKWGTTAVTSKEHLIVAGGTIGSSDADVSNTVALMDTKSLVWSTVASLPHPYSIASVAVCGDQLYMLGGADDKGKTKSVLTCSLTELLQSSSSSSSIWHRVADAPAYNSTCVAINGELLAIGGCDKEWKPSSAIHKFNPTTNSWDLISNMPTARFKCLVAVLPTNEMMVVGGNVVYGGNSSDKTEIASFSLS
jgi:hypothetical protein